MMTTQSYTVIDVEDKRLERPAKWKLLHEAGYPVIAATGHEEACRMGSQERPAMLLLQEDSDERFRILADHAPVLMWMNGQDGCNLVNRACLDFVHM